MKIFDLYLGEIAILYYIQVLCLFIISIVFYSLNSLFKVYPAFKRKIFIEIFFVSISSSFLGTTLGLYIGLSNSPVVGTFIPALLTFLSGIITYFFISKKEQLAIENRIIVSINLILISFFLVIGALKGAEERMKVDIEKQYREYVYKVKEKEIDLRMKLEYEKSLKDSSEFETTEMLNLDQLKEAFQNK